ncbi:DUF2817 domain-containing protein [candidate division TA06 bacterium]|nr:DUF2817 domain-containing protein [candidate division TA06 bacterium]
MKIKLLLIPVMLLLLVPAGLQAQSGSLIPVKIYISSHDDVYKFQKLGVGIEELRDGYIEARIAKSKYDELISLGWKVEGRLVKKIDPKIALQYHNYIQMTNFLDSIHALYPAITKKVSIGQSVQGRELWAFLVTDNPDSAENEAEVRLAANIHGDETVGRELCLAMIDSLTKVYGGVSPITDMVNTREIWFMPSLNPDGYELDQRYNANGVDLNRNYPVPDGSIGEDGTYVNEVETQLFMDFWSSKRAVLSLNYHGGALVANYPWDYTVIRCPDDLLAKEVSLGYSRLNPPMYASAVFDSGVTNGWDWYYVYGSLQDWSYHGTSCLDVTMEIGTKWPEASTLPAYWSDNRGGMLFFIRQAGLGLQGLVTDSATGLPLDFAQVEVAGIDKPVYCDSIGDYHRMLLSGAYDLTFSKDGYFPKTISGVRVNYDSLTSLDVALVKDPGGVEGNPCEIVAQRIKLLKTYPNPLHNSVTVAFQLFQRSSCDLRIYNVAGQQVRKILDRTMDPGIYDINWNGIDDAGRKTADGVYCFCLDAGGQKIMGKMVKID